MKQVCIVYHQAVKPRDGKPGIDCPDGIMAAAIATSYYTRQGFEVSYRPDFYRRNEEYPDLPDFELPPCDTLCIVDFSYKAEWLNYWKQRLDVVVIDHHAPKFPLLEGFSGAILDANECGASLTWKHFFPSFQVPPLMAHIRRRDIGVDGYYDGLCRGSEAINEVLGSRRHSLKEECSEDLKLYCLTLFDYLCCESSIISRWVEEGMPAVEEKYRISHQACDRALLRELEGFPVPWVKLTPEEDKYHSTVGNLLCQRFPEARFGWVTSSDGISNHLRSTRPDSPNQHLASVGFNTEPIARGLGGGGHEQASGWQGKVS